MLSVEGRSGTIRSKPQPDRCPRRNKGMKDMNTLSAEKRKLLLENHPEPCISLYLPTNGAGAELQQDQIRLKQQMRQAENLLFLANVPAAEVEDLLEPIGALLDDEA